MIRKLTVKDKISVLEYLSKEPSLNLFMIGDIENFGFDTDFQDVYADIVSNQYQSVLLRYRENLLFYTHKELFNDDYLEIIKLFKFNFVSCSKRISNIIEDKFTYKKKREMFFAEATTCNFDFIHDDSIKLIQTEEGFVKIHELLKQITEFENVNKQTTKEFVRNKLRSIEFNKTYGIIENNICVSTAATTASNSKSAMVIAVGTHKDYRKKGLASLVMKELMNDFINEEKKSLCLFYDNEAAGKIYKRLGFKDIDKWVMFIR